MNRKETYVCQTTPRDILVTYVTSSEGQALFALVCESDNGQITQKASTLLDRDSAIRLQNQLNDFIINGAQEL